MSTSEGSGGGGRSQWYGEQAQRYAETTSADVSELLPQSQSDTKATRAEKVVARPAKETRAEEVVVPSTAESEEAAEPAEPAEPADVEETAPEPASDTTTPEQTEQAEQTEQTADEPSTPAPPPANHTRLDLPVQRKPEPEPEPTLEDPAGPAQEGPPPPFDDAPPPAAQEGPPPPYEEATPPEAAPQQAVPDEGDPWGYAPEGPADPWVPAPKHPAGAWSTPAEAAQDRSALADFFGTESDAESEGGPTPEAGFPPENAGGFVPDGGAQGYPPAYPQTTAMPQGQPFGPPQPPRQPTGIWHPRHLPVGAFVVAYGIAGTFNALFRWDDHKAEIANLLNKTVDSGASSAGGILVAVHIVEVLLTLVAIAGLARKRYVWYLPALVGWMAGFGVFVVLDLWAGDLGKLLEHVVYLGGFTVLLFLSYALGVKARMNGNASAPGSDAAAGGDRPLTRTQELALSALNNWRR